jgi:dipeptidyl aminopeptidase/acylaminoacyl peptidase
VKKRLLVSVLALILVSALGEGSCGSSEKQGEITAGPGTPLSVTPDDPVEVYVMSIDGEPRVLTTLSSVPRLAWAPDDDHVALVTDITSRSGSIHIISANSGTDIVTADVAGNPRRLAWSPDGEWLAWESNSQYGVTLEAMRVDGSDRRELASNSNSWAQYGVVFGWKDDHTLLATVWKEPNSLLFEFDLANGTEREVGTQPEASSAELSRDASRVVFVVGGGPQGCSPREFASSVWVMDVPTGGLQQVLPATCVLYSASWSPDGSQIAYAVGEDNARGTYILDLASGTSRKLASSSTLFDHVQRWSSDGSVLVVERTECPDGGECPGPLHELVSISVASGDENFIPGAFHAFSPNGGAVAFQKDGLQVARFPSGTLRQVMAADSDWRFDMLGWSPDGQWFAFARSRVSTPNPSP